MNEIWVVDFYSDEDWESTLNHSPSRRQDLNHLYQLVQEYSLLDKLRDEALND